MGTFFNPFRTNIFIGNATRQGGWWMFGLCILSILSGCAQGKRNEKERPIFSCILLGYDSLACYAGNSADMRDFKSGNLTNEQRVFYTTSLQTAMARGRDTSHPLILPKEENPPGTADTSSPNRLVILLFGDQGIYVYTGTGIRAGKKYTYRELQKWLKEKKSTSLGTILIKPAASTTYKNTVNILDALKLAGITRYALVNISPAEEAYVQKIK
jgi:biopolymer transport protein ExbD